MEVERRQVLGQLLLPPTSLCCPRHPLDLQERVAERRVEPRDVVEGGVGGGGGRGGGGGEELLAERARERQVEEAVVLEGLADEPVVVVVGKWVG